MAEKGNLELKQTRVYSSGAPPPYSPPQPSHVPMAVQPGPTTVVQQGTTTVIHGPGVTVRPSTVPPPTAPNQLPPSATAYTCPSCNHQIVTRVEYKPSTRTHVFAFLFCIFLLWPCVCIPYCMDSCNRAHHFCPNCSAYIGTYD